MPPPWAASGGASIDRSIRSPAGPVEAQLLVKVEAHNRSVSLVMVALSIYYFASAFIVVSLCHPTGELHQLQLGIEHLFSLMCVPILIYCINFTAADGILEIKNCFGGGSYADGDSWEVNTTSLSIGHIRNSANGECMSIPKCIASVNASISTASC